MHYIRHAASVIQDVRSLLDAEMPSILSVRLSTCERHVFVTYSSSIAARRVVIIELVWDAAPVPCLHEPPTSCPSGAHPLCFDLQRYWWNSRYITIPQIRAL